MDFIHLSERNNFFYIHNKLKNKIFGQVQTWVKTMTEREIFSVNFFFPQLILIYDNFQSIKIAAKKLNKIKQNNKQCFRRSFRISKKKLKTGGRDFNDQITKTVFNNFFNNEMHKFFIGFFILTIYTVYCTTFYDVNN